MKQLIALILTCNFLFFSVNAQERRAKKVSTEMKQVRVKEDKNRQEGVHTVDTAKTGARKMERTEHHRADKREKGNESDREENEMKHGNAYGKDKKGREGKEFGQHRAEEAKERSEKRKSLEQNVKAAEEKVASSKERIRKANDKLEKEKKEKKISEEEYQRKKAKIEEATKAVNDLEERVNKGKGTQAGE